MDMQLYRVRLMGLLVLLAVAIIVWVPQVWSTEDVLALVLEGDAERAGSEYLQIHFLDVGQGDATYIETPDGVQLLVDGGEGRRVLRQLGAVMSPLDRQLDMIIATHPHDDHVGGLVDVLDRFAVEHLLVTENRLDTRSVERFFVAVEEEVETGATVYQARAGQTFALGASTTVKILSPVYDPTDMDANASSIVVQLSYGDVEVLLSGDIPVEIEDFLVEAHGSGLASELLKLGHHGSRTSSGELFLDTVQPDYGITSAGVDSQHGHPHEEVIDRIEARGIEHLSTKDGGTISFFSDGERVWLAE